MNKMVAAALIGLVLLLGYFLIHDANPDAVQQETPELYVTPVFERTVVPDSDAQLVVTVIDEVVLEQSGLTREAAQASCEAIAYNTDYMWQQIVCTFEGEEIYNDIFIAG